MADNFSTEVAQVGDETIIHVRGEIDVATCERLRDTIEPHLGPQQAIVLDLSEVEFMDSSCLRVLQQARGTLTADGGSLFLRNPSRAHGGPSPSPRPRISSRSVPTTSPPKRAEFRQR